MATKERNIFSALKKPVDAVVLVNGVEPNLDLSFFYATGITSGLFEGCVAVLKRRSVEVLTSELEELSAKQAGVRISVYENGKERKELIARKLKGLERIGVNSREITHENFLSLKKLAKGTKLVDVSHAIEEARMMKDDDEITRIRKACEIASRTAADIPEFIRVGHFETEAAAEINYKMMRLGAGHPSFETNASFGPNTAEPHYVPGAGRLKKGDFALFDFGASYKKYVSDITRTFVAGRPSKEQEHMYGVVLEAQLAAIDAVRDGAHGKDVDTAARSVVDRSKYKGKFIHSTGHGLGVSVHDPGSISSSRDMILREGMVLTVEPGVYRKGFGGVRIEDDVLVKKKGCRILTTAPKEFMTI